MTVYVPAGGASVTRNGGFATLTADVTPPTNATSTLVTTGTVGPGTYLIYGQAIIIGGTTAGNLSLSIAIPTVTLAAVEDTYIPADTFRHMISVAARYVLTAANQIQLQCAGDAALAGYTVKRGSNQANIPGTSLSYVQLA